MSMTPARVLVCLITTQTVLIGGALFRIVERGALAEALTHSPRPRRPVRGCNRRLSVTEVDQLVEDYRSSEGSIYDLADIYSVHRSTVYVPLKERGVLLGPSPLQDFEAKRAREPHAQGLSP